MVIVYRIANLQERLGDHLLSHLISRQWRSIPLETMAALEGELYDIVPCLGLCPPLTSPFWATF